MKIFYAVVLTFFLGLVSLHAFAEPVNVNTADAPTLAKSLSGVGPSTAQAIIDYRTKHGPFKSVEELARVKGIGSKLIEKNRGNVVVAQPAN